MKKIIKPISLMLAASLVATSCGGDDTTGGSTTTEGGTTTEASTGYEETITVDVYSDLANYQGIQSGWFGKVVKDKFNMELNIIAPNVAGGGDTLYQTRVAAGDLGDLIITTAEKGRLNDLAKYGLLYDITSTLEDETNLQNYKAGIDSINSLVEVDGTYAVPVAVSNKAATEPSEGLEPTYAPYIRWDLYKQLGYPEISSVYDMLPILKQMQDLYPQTETGKKVYGFSMFADWDGNLMMYAKQIACMYGFEETGYLLYKADGSEFQDFLSEDGLYYKDLEFLFEANQMGLVDPESTTQNFDVVFSKYQEGAVLFSPWPWLGQSAYNTDANKAEGKGFMMAPVSDLNVFSAGARPLGDKVYYAIGSKAEDPERLMDFIDWLYSPEGIYTQNSGPEGLTWEMKDGQPVLTEFGQQAWYSSEAVVPEEWGGGAFLDGDSPLAGSVTNTDIDPATGVPYLYSLWPSVLNKDLSPLDQDWREKMGADSTTQYLKDKNAFLVANGTGYVSPAESSEISTIRGQVSSIIKEYSWRMVFAKDRAEFDTLYNELVTNAKGLGYETVLEFDMQVAQEAADARAAAAK